MNKSIKLLSAISSACLVGSLAVAQTNWTNGDPTDNNLDRVLNWDNGLPNSTNIGTIGSGDTARVVSGTTYTGYYLDLQTGGTMTGTGLSNAILSNGQLTINGGTVSVGRGLSYNGGTTVTLNTGTYNMSDANVQLTDVGTSFTVEGGAVNGPTNRSFWVESGTTLTINDGAIGSSGAYISGITGRTNFGGSAGTVNFGGGDTFATSLGGGFATGAVITYNVLGSSGSVNAVNFSNTKTLIDWSTGAGMTFQVSGVADWAETEWAAGRLTYNGADFSTLGDWSTVTTTGLDGTYAFDFDGGTNTLSLAVIPEPSTFALMGLAGLAVFVARRRRG